MKITFAAILEWIAIAEQLLARGEKAFADIKAALAANGIEADTASLDLVIADAERRKQIAAAEASDPTGGGQ